MVKPDASDIEEQLDIERFVLTQRFEDYKESQREALTLARESTERAAKMWITVIGFFFTALQFGLYFLGNR